MPESLLALDGRTSPVTVYAGTDVGVFASTDGGASWRARFGMIRGMIVVKINAIEVPEGMGAELEKRFGARVGEVEKMPGFAEFDTKFPGVGDFAANLSRLKTRVKSLVK